MDRTWGEGLVTLLLQIGVIVGLWGVCIYLVTRAMRPAQKEKTDG